MGQFMIKLLLAVVYAFGIVNAQKGRGGSGGHDDDPPHADPKANKDGANGLNPPYIWSFAVFVLISIIIMGAVPYPRQRLRVR
jgi:hypothetical protein